MNVNFWLTSLWPQNSSTRTNKINRETRSRIWTQNWKSSNAVSSGDLLDCSSFGSPDIIRLVFKLVIDGEYIKRRILGVNFFLERLHWASSLQIMAARDLTRTRDPTRPEIPMHQKFGLMTNVDSELLRVNLGQRVSVRSSQKEDPEPQLKLVT